MNERIETAIRALGLLLVPSVLVIILSAGGVSASDGALELSDFNREGLEVEVAALFEAGGAGSEPALYSASGSRWTESGSLVDGEVLLGEGSSIVRVMLPESDGSLLRLNHDGPFGAEGLFRIVGRRRRFDGVDSDCAGGGQLRCQRCEDRWLQLCELQRAPGYPVRVERYRFRRPIHPCPHPPRAGAGTHA